VARNRPAQIGATVAVVASSSNTLTVVPPSGLAKDDLIIVAARAQLSSATGDYASSGWSRLGPAFVASSTAARVLGFYAYRVTNPAALPASWTLTYTGSASREIAHVTVWRNVDTTTPVDAFYNSYQGSQAAQALPVTIPAYAATTDNGTTLVVIGAEFTAGQSHDLSATPTGYTQLAYTATATGTSASRTASGLFTRSQDAGSTAAFSASWAAAAGGAAQSITLRGAEAVTETPTPSGVDVQVWDADTSTWVEATAFYADGTNQVSIDRLLTLRLDRITVDKWLAKEYGPSYMVHRGGSLDSAEHTRQAYTNAVWLGATCLEASVWFSTDDVAFMCHDPDLSAMTGGTDTRRIDQMTAAQLDAVTVTKAGAGSGEKLARLSWLLETYGNTCIVIVEDKSYGHMAQLVALFEQYGRGDPTSRFMVKANGGGGTGHMTLPNSKGYRSWGYFYTHNATPIPPEAVPDKARLYTTIGIEWDSTPEAYTAALTLGIPLVVHIVPSAAAAATAKQRGGSAVGMQISSPLAVIPRLNEPLN